MESREQQPVPPLFQALADRYAFEGVIACGGMADVFHATDLRHDRRVAVKVLRVETMTSVDRERFLREIAIVAKLSHPNIIPLFDSGQFGPFLYYVMPFVEGSSLKERLASGSGIGMQEGLRIVEDVGRALAYAHAQGFVHRDIKPANILLDVGQARVADFGIAKALSDSENDSLTTGTAAIGTLAYMSPEQATAGSPVDERSDVYSLALVLYEILAGCRPFPATNPSEMVVQKMLGKPRAIRSFNASVPENIERALMRALSPIPGNRYSSVAEFVRALHSASVSPQTGSNWRTAKLAIATVFLVIISVAVTAWLKTSAPLSTDLANLGRIVVVPLKNRTRNVELDQYGLMAADYLTSGLQEIGLTDVAPTPNVYEIDSIARRDNASVNTLVDETGATTLLYGDYALVRDSVRFRLLIADKRGRHILDSITDVSVHVRDLPLGIDALRSRLMGWIAIRSDSRIQLPTSAKERSPIYSAYKQFSVGMGEYIATRNDSAAVYFLEAYRLDSSFVTALLYGAMAVSNTGNWPRADSLLTFINERRDQLTEYNRGWLDYRIGMARGNPTMALSSIRIVVTLAPHSKASYNHAVTAYQNGYLHESLAALESLQPDRGSMRGYAPYWSIKASALHSLGDFDGELEVARKSRAMYANRMIVYPQLLRPLAVLGRFAELDSHLVVARNMKPETYLWDYGQLLMEVGEELRAHGYAGSASNYFQQLLQWLESQPDTPSVRWREIETLYALERWQDALAKLHVLRLSVPLRLEHIGMKALILSHMGNRTESDAVADSLETIRLPYSLALGEQYLARVHALAGRQEQALAKLQYCLDNGRPYHLWLHRDPDLASLRSHEQFTRILRGRD